MLFSSVTFLYYFLPAALLAYHLTPRPGGSQRWRNLVLLVASLVFYAWGEPRHVVVMLGEIAVVWALGLVVDKARGRPWSKVALVASLAVGLGALACFKYADFLIANVDAALKALGVGSGLALIHLALPLGISFYTFQMLSYSIDLYRGKVALQRNPLDFACYVTAFPQLIAGPIVRYADIAAQLADRRTSVARFGLGARRFTIGLAKKVLLANVLGELVDTLKASGDETVLAAWLYVVAFGLHIYFDFSGYSDMAIGLGHMLGFRFPENFDYPYTARSVTEFWRRWHMTLSSWFRDYVYIPLGGNRVGVARHLRNIAVVWGLTGLWHGADWQFLCWGLYFAVLLSVEKYVGGGVLRRLPGAAGHVYLLVVVGVSWVFFDAADFAQAGHTLAQLAGPGATGMTSPTALYYARDYAVPLALAALGATGLPKRWADRHSGWAMAILEPLTVAVLLILVTAFLVDGSFNPFIYFRF